MYDGATAAAEAVLMALRARPAGTRVRGARGACTRTTRGGAATYRGAGSASRSIDAGPRGADDAATALRASARRRRRRACSCSSPNFLGCIEDAARGCARRRTRAGALLVVGAPTRSSLGAAASRRARCGADIASARASRSAPPLSFGGPDVGLFARREEHVRQHARAGSSARPSTPTAGAASCSRCRRASSTSAARRRRRTSAPTRA